MTKEQFSYSLMVRTLFRDPHELLESMNAHKVNLMHAAVGISGEAGEFLDAVKKYWAYGQCPDRKNMVEELGDIEFYLEAARQDLGITREEVLEANRAKLAVRYEGMKFTPEAAQKRADKLPEQLQVNESGRLEYMRLNDVDSYGMDEGISS